MAPRSGPSTARKLDIFATALSAVASSLAPAATASSPTLYGPSGRIIPDSQYTYRRQAARRTGSMKNWVPQPLYGPMAEALERQQIVARAIDLAQNDPNAAGIVDAFAATVIGAGLTPVPAIDRDLPGMTPDAVRALSAAQTAVYRAWYPWADAGERLTYGAIQYLALRSIVEYGEYLILLPMLDDPVRPYRLACQVVNPLRLRSPVDLASNSMIKDGVEMGPYGQPVAYWIKRPAVTPAAPALADVSANFIRVPARRGHRWNVLHGFLATEPEQVRGIPWFAPAMKYLRDLNDYLDAELVSNIVTAAFALFIETGAQNDPYNIAQNLASITETGYKSDGSAYDQRYQELVPGAIMYGAQGERPHPIAASRPGQTFEPFTRTIKKAIAMGLGIPYPVLFRDVDGVNFAGFRSAMLDAWRVYDAWRTRLGQALNQPIYTMLMEEAYLMGQFAVPGDAFYSNMPALTRADWRGAPKGDIEPIKAVKADVLAIQNNIKTRADAIAERGGDIRTTFDQLAEEERMMDERGLTEQPFAAPAPEDGDDPDNPDRDPDNADTLNDGADDA